MRLVVCIFLLIAARLVHAESAVSVTAELPISFREGLLWVEVNVPQSDKPLHFLLDTGASASVVNLSTARRLGLKLGPEVKVSGVKANVSGYWPVKLSAKFEAGGPTNHIELPGEYLALDLSKLSGGCSRSVDGLLGADFFRGRVVEIDYTMEKLRVLDSAPLDANANVIPLEVRPCDFRVSVSVNGGDSQPVRLDTGCATALQWVTTKVRATRCTTKPAVGLAELSIPQTMTGVRLGNRYLGTVPTGLHRKAIFPGESGLLGNGLLAQFGIVTIDAKAGRLILAEARAAQ